MEPRTIRVFISSTFRDMNAERDYLNNIVFPQVELYCKQRFLSFIPIDLRWGIPEEYSRNGLVLSACMEEIDNSRPFFIGILGSRYGWNPKPTELNGLRVSEQQQNWIKSMSADGASITEMEMEYGVLRDMDMPYASFFIRSDKVDVPDGFREEKGSLAEKHLEKLKRRIRTQQKYPVTEYDTVQQLGDAILKQLVAMIELEYPSRGNDEAASIIEKQECALDRQSRTLFDLSKTLEQFNQWVSEHGRLLLITGDPGSGTSTALAYCVSELRNRYSSKIIYFDFKTLDAGINPLDALFRFLSMKENRVPDNQWGMIAIDNTSVLGAEEEKRIIKWLNGMGRNIVVAIATTYDCDLRWTIQYNFNCPEINIKGLTNELKKQFIQKYAQQYAKGLSTEQLDMLVNNIKSDNIGILESLVRLLVKYGSFEHLNERISSLIDYSYDHNLFSLLFQEAIKSFEEIGLHNAYYDATTCLSLVANGIPEEDLLHFTKLTQAEWSVIRPSVLLFCKGNANCLKFSNYSWRSAMRDCGSSTMERASFGKNMIKWYLSDPKKWKRCARIVSDIFEEIWAWGDELDDLEEVILAFAKSPDMIKQLKDSDLGLLWSHITKNMFDNSIRLYGRSVEELSSEEAIVYYLRLAKAAKANRRGKDVADCYVEISKIKEKEGMADADFYRYRSTLEIGCPEMTIFFVDRSGILQGERRGWLTGRLQAKYSLEQQLYAHLVMLEAFILRGDYNNAGVELQRFRDKAESLFNNATGIIREVVATGFSYMAYVLSGYYPLGNNKVAKELLQMAFEKNMKMELCHESTYFKYMAWACLEYQAKSYDKMLTATWWAITSARFAYGGESYQYARAHLMYAFAHYNLYGNYGIKNNAFTSIYQALNYFRSFENNLNRNIDWGKIETGVKRTLLEEYKFFWNLERAMSPAAQAQEFLDKKMKQNRISIGLGE